MKKLLLIFFAVPVLADGPKYQSKDPYTQQEFQNVYHDLKYINAVTATISSATISNLSGTTTNNNAGTGNVGEYVSSYATIINAAASGSYLSLASISLTAGDWDVSGGAQLVINGATITSAAVGIDDNASGTNLRDGDNYMTYGSFAASNALSIPSYRVSLSATTTIHLLVISSYTGGPPRFRGRISARRVR